MSKKDISAQLASDLELFYQMGGTVTLVPAKKVSKKNTAACRHRRGIATKGEGSGSMEPRSVHSWCNWTGDRLLNIEYKAGKALTRPKPLLV